MDKQVLKMAITTLEISKNMITNVVNMLKKMIDNLSLDNEIERAFKDTGIELGQANKRDYFLSEKQRNIEFLRKCFEMEYKKQ
jgi:hypothetical protein